jgi:hypothetical protein
MPETLYTAPLLVSPIQQRPNHDLLTPIQLDEAKKAGVIGVNSKSTQRDLIKLVKFQKRSLRKTSKYIKHLVKQHGRKRAKPIYNDSK